MEVQNLHLGHCSYFLLGIGTLMPWNAFITAVDYWQNIFPGQHVDRLITVSYLPLNLIVLALFVSYHNAGHAGIRILGGFCAFALAMLLMPTVDILGSPSLFFVLFFVALCGAADGAVQGALFGQAATTADSRNTQAIIIGTSVSGIVVCIIRIITKAGFHGDAGVRLSSNVYFILSALLCGTCIVVYLTIIPKYRNVQFIKEYEFQGHDLAEVDDLVSQIDTNGHAALEHAEGEESCRPVQRVGYIQVACHVKEPLFALILCYIITLSIFPGVITEDINQHERDSWFPILLLTCFNIADFCGKGVPVSWQQHFFGKYKLLIFSCVRLLFIPLFMVIIKIDAGSFPIAILTFLLGLSNGALTALSMIYATALVEDTYAVDLAGNLAVLALTLGLTLGAFSGFLWLL